jgi:hypothetical protein
VCQLIQVACNSIAATRIVINKTSSGTFRNGEHKLYQDFLYFHNITRFYGTDLYGMQFHLHPKKICRLSRNLQTLNSITCRSMIPNFIQFGQQMWKVCLLVNLRTCVKNHFHFAYLCEVYNPIATFLWTHPLPNCIQVSHKMYKLRKNFMHSRKLCMTFIYVYFYEYKTNSVNLLGNLYRM